MLDFFPYIGKTFVLSIVKIFKYPTHTFDTLKLFKKCVDPVTRPKEDLDLKSLTMQIVCF